jgi:YD repeat-containing protein
VAGRARFSAILGPVKERHQWGLRGPVHTCQLQRTWFTRRCGADACETEERGDSTVLEFREDGSLAGRSHRNPDGPEWTSSYQYDAGRLTAVRTENGASLVSLNIYEYDALGRLVRVTARSANGGDRTAECYDYDPDGRKKKTFYVDVANQRPNTQYAWGAEGTDSCYSAPGAATLTTLYNEREQPTHLLFYDATDRLLSRVEFSYDADANLIEEAQTNTADTVAPEMLTALNPAQLETVRAMLGAAGEPIRRMHRYDGNGRRIETRSRMGLVGEAIQTMVCNDLGDQIAEISEHEEREYGIDDNGQLTDAPTKESVNRWEARFRYDYDANGNWVLKTGEAWATEEQGSRNPALSGARSNTSV